MKKTFLLLSLMFVCFAVTAQTKNSKGVLHRGVLTLNNGATISKGDKVTLGAPKNDAERFTYVYDQKHMFGLFGGDGTPKTQQYKMFVIHFLDAVKDQNSNEKKFIAAIGLGDKNSLWTCDIIEAIESGEIFMAGISPETVKSNKIETQGIAQIKEEIIQDNEIPLAAKTKENTITDVLQTKTETTTVVKTVELNSNNLLQRLNELQKSKEITDNEHYQLLKIITGSNDNIDDKKGLIKKLQTLRNNQKITIDEYDKIVDLLI
jgi:hypothetical protein